jgi:Flp pilus assembly protein TadD
MGRRGVTPWCAAFAAAALLAAAPQAHAFSFPKLGKAKAEATRQSVEPLLANIDQALEENRLVDAGRLLDTAYANEVADKRLLLRSGELHLARGRYEEAVRTFSDAEAAPGGKALALQGRGIALAQLGRSDEAATVLKSAVTADPTLWRAWDALAVEKDRRHDWLGAEAAYAEALKAPGAKAYVLNNRGYSRLLQGRYEQASADFVKALESDPALAQARTNLRLSLALRGDYRRATAVSGAEDRATILNNAGFAAVLRGDLADAEDLFQQAIDARGSSYGRAIENLKMVKALKNSGNPATKTP